MPLERWLYACRARWQRVTRRSQADQELNDEIAHHLQLETEQNLASGMSPVAAARAARMQLGNPQRVQEDAREVWSTQWVADLNRDARVAVRGLRKDRSVAVAVLLTLALCIGANTAVFSVVNAIVVRPLPSPDADALVSLWHEAPGLPQRGDGRLTCSPSMFFSYRDQNAVFESFGLWSTRTVIVAGERPQRVPALLMTHGVLDALGVGPALGRWFSPEDDTPGSPETVVLTHGYWERRYGGDPDVLGQAVSVNGRPRVVVGVMPRSFRLLTTDAELFLPYQFDRDAVHLGDYSYMGLARVRPGVTIAQVDADIDRMLPGWLVAWPAPSGFAAAVFHNLGLAASAQSLKRDVVGDVGGVLWVVMGAVGVVLLIGCANVANLMLVRIEGRRRELAVRAALGAGWGRIARTLLCESMVWAVAGGLVGLGVAYAALRGLVVLGPDTLPRLEHVSMDLSVLAFAGGVSVLSGLLFGFAALFKCGPVDILPALQGGGRSMSLTRERRQPRNTLVVVQVALVLVLLVAASLMLQTAHALRELHPGFVRADEVQLVRVSVPEEQLEDPVLVFRQYQRIRDALAAIPGVDDVAFTTAAPLEGGRTDAIVAADTVAREGSVPPLRRSKFVSPGMLRTLGTSLIAGRDFTWADIYQYRPVAMVSEQVAVELWGSSESAVGQRIWAHALDPWREVIGIVDEVHDDGLDRPAPSTIYWPGLMRQFVGTDLWVRPSVVFLVRSSRTGEAGFLDDVNRVIQATNGTIALGQTRTLQSLAERSLARTSFALVMLAISGAVALALGVVGIYGVIWYSVTHRAREVSIRLVLGAQPGTLRRMFVRHGLRLAVVGVGCGLALATVMSPLLSSLLFGVSPLDPRTYVAVGLALTAAATLASYCPARRAVAADPLFALRGD